MTACIDQGNPKTFQSIVDSVLLIYPKGNGFALPSGERAGCDSNKVFSKFTMLQAMLELFMGSNTVIDAVDT
jgi:hypothetical protein